MRRPALISIETARQLLDFRGPEKTLSEAAAEEQLRGAVALHNILSARKVAYLADEVGMGKTYVALGAVALFRHYDPTFRLLVIAPRENIQRKWMKELRNFVRNNVRFADLRVKAVHGAPARGSVACNTLTELVRETALNPDRDFFARLTSFSVALGSGRTSMDRYLEQLRTHLPWAELHKLDVDLREKDAVARFKDAFAATVCAALPRFDLVIVDEGHNLKHGFSEKVAARNRVLALAFGHPRGKAKADSGYGRRAQRVLFLSATPLENDYVQLWNQLDVFGFGEVAPTLISKDASEDQKRAAAQQFLIRRVTALTVGGRRLTKNLYRREWRRGGVTLHDQPLEVPANDRDRQRLIVALVQKKVSELLRHERFNNSFQIGMLASFESFFETAKIKPASEDAEPSSFDDAEQAEDAEERLGIDVGAVNRLARSFRKHFSTEMPHPKMDSLVDQLAMGFREGRKALIFVRRVASVKELQAKLEERYDTWLIERLRSELPPEVRNLLDKAFADYRQQRAERRNRQLPLTAADAGELEEGEVGVIVSAPDDDRGGLDSFFAWFFRGEGPAGILSGAALQRRFTQASSAYSTFFEDNHVSALLEASPGTVLDALSSYLGISRQAAVRQLTARAEPLLPAGRRDAKVGRLHLFLAVQQAALSLIVENPGALKEKAEAVWRTMQDGAGGTQRGARFPGGPERWLEEPTFFTELRSRPALRARLWPEPLLKDGVREAFREQELRRLLLSGIARLGHAFVDLWILAIGRLGTIRLGAREEEAGLEGLISAYADELQRQMSSREGDFRAFRELSLAAEHFKLIVTVNAPDLWTKSHAEGIRDMARLLGRQQPIGGMFGQINGTLVRQFRLPGYPFVLVTTDLLQEGEDLHTFCSAVYHYGISWMPSSMEQRVGRIDRVNSETERRLIGGMAEPSGDDKLQVYYPHLRETVEVLQVRRVLGRIDEFLRLMHRDLVLPEDKARRVSIEGELQRFHEELLPITEPLNTAFPIPPELVEGEARQLAILPAYTERLLERFGRIKQLSFRRLSVRWEQNSPEDSLMGTVVLGSRQQPFTLLLRSLAGRLMVRCISPIGMLGGGYDVNGVAVVTLPRRVQVAAIYDPRFATYNLTVERETLLAKENDDLARIDDLIEDVVQAADVLEKRLLERDEPLVTFRKDLERESENAD